MAVQEYAGEQARSHAVEDYCKAIYTLQSRGEAPVSTNALAERLQITPGSVSAMLKRLDGEGLIVRVPYRGVRLTPVGRRVALEVIRHHRLLELFLAETLQMPWDRVHDEAEVLEHVLSEELEQLIADKLGDPTRDPHGDPIPMRSWSCPSAITAAASTVWVWARAACSCACPTPTRRCSATCPSMASPRETACA
ncbi:MAG: metal-dependent transcriptional regulator [Solirubrobacteraceae bacterium]|jgi:DtxR family Mn-dependent transcriptional regulator